MQSAIGLFDTKFGGFELFFFGGSYLKRSWWAEFIVTETDGISETGIVWVVPASQDPIDKGLGWDPPVKKCKHPDDDYYQKGGTNPRYSIIVLFYIP